MTTAHEDSPTHRIDALMGFDSHSMGDEREGRIILQASSVAAVFTVYLLVGLAAVLSITGSALMGAGVLLSSALPSAVMF